MSYTDILNVLCFDFLVVTKMVMKTGKEKNISSLG
jgi:hypothetical protein